MGAANRSIQEKPAVPIAFTDWQLHCLVMRCSSGLSIVHDDSPALDHNFDIGQVSDIP